MARDLERELNEWDGEWPPNWTPAVGEVLVGKVIRYASGPTKYGPCRTLIVERDDGSRVTLWLSSTVLLDLFRKERPTVGERIGVKHLGKHPEKGYRRWALMVERPDTAQDFSPLGGELRQQEPSARTGSVSPEGRPDRDRASRPYAAATVSGAAPPYDDDDPFA